MQISTLRKLPLVMFVRECLMVVPNLDTLLVHWTRSRFSSARDPVSVVVWLSQLLLTKKISIRFTGERAQLWDATPLEIPVSMLSGSARKMHEEILRNWSLVFQRHFVRHSANEYSDSIVTAADLPFLDLRLVVGRLLSLLMKDLRGPHNLQVNTIFMPTVVRMYETFMTCSESSEDNDARELYAYLADVARYGSCDIIENGWDSDAQLIPRFTKREDKLSPVTT